MKRLTILGSTGSIGRSALNIVKELPERFSVKALAAGSNVELLAKQIDRFHPEIVAVLNAERATELEKLVSIPRGLEIVWGQKGYHRTATLETVDMVISAMVGAAGSGVAAAKDAETELC